MTDPPDMEQEMLREFIDAEKACPDPPAEVGQRVFTRLAASIGLAPGLPDGVPTTAGEGQLRTGLLQRTVTGFSKRGVVTFLVGAAVGAATYGTVSQVRGKPAPSAPMVIVAPPPLPAPPSPVPPPIPEPVAEPQPVVTLPHRMREAEPNIRDARDRGLGAERKLVEMARSALARGHTDRALSALRTHARSFPNGQLAEERDSLMVQALVAKGESAQARERAARFQKQHPGSLFGPVVEQALRSIP
jgi:hypothetical protein